MKTLYVSDLDGTLLTPDSRVSARSAEILSHLSAQGALITVATARTPATVEPLLADVNSTLPAIVMTGASLWDRKEKRYVDTRFIDADTSRIVRETAARYGVNPFTYTLGDNGILEIYRNGVIAPCDRKFIDERSNLPLKHFHIDTPQGDDYALPRTVLFFAMGNPDRIFPLADELRATTQCSVSSYIDIFGDDTAVLEVLAPGLSKADSVKKIARQYDADRIVAFGDNLNDLSMMKIADVAVAVGNARDEVKEVAHTIIGTNTEDSVARFIADDFNAMQ